jgi:L-ascorbate metabolism protein UlaG (beta-lactamase superfamily)
MKIRYFAHSAFSLRIGTFTILIDPFLDGNPNSPVKADAVAADFIIVTHGHGDHLGDTIKIAKRTKAEIICIYELANILEEKGLKTHGLQIGGSSQFPFGRVKFTQALHGSEVDGVYAGPPAGVLIMAEEKIVYHTGDTGLFGDMRLIGDMHAVDVLMLPIGDYFTMGIADASVAVDFIRPKLAIPMHYNTFPVIAADPHDFVAKIVAAGHKGKVLNFGEEIELSF